jgi:hypothetical protein
MDPLGMIALFALLFLRRGSGGKSSGRSATPTTRAQFANAWKQRCVELMARARTGAAWAPRMSAVLGSDLAGAAAARWIGIESGGNAVAVSPLAERGLAQVSPGSFAELGLSQADFDAMNDPKTPADRQAQLAGRVMFACVAKATQIAGFRMPPPEWGPALGPSALTTQTVSLNGIASGKVYHALPALAVELAKQNHWRTTIPLTVRSMLTGGFINVAGRGQVEVKPFAPTDQLARFARGKEARTGDVVMDLALRFLAPAAVIGRAELAFELGGEAVS